MAEDLMMILAAGIQADNKQATNMNEQHCNINRHANDCCREWIPRELPLAFGQKLSLVDTQSSNYLGCCSWWRDRWVKVQGFRRNTAREAVKIRGVTETNAFGKVENKEHTGIAENTPYGCMQGSRTIW